MRFMQAEQARKHAEEKARIAKREADEKAAQKAAEELPIERQRRDSLTSKERQAEDDAGYRWLGIPFERDIPYRVSEEEKREAREELRKLLEG